MVEIHTWVPAAVTTEVLMQASMTLMSGHQKPQGHPGQQSHSHPVRVPGPQATELTRGTETVTPLDLQLYTCVGSALFHSCPLSTSMVAPPFCSVPTLIVPKTLPKSIPKTALLKNFAIRESREAAQCLKGPEWSMESFCLLFLMR